MVSRQRQQGLALSVILLAIVLLAALAVTIALSGRTGAGNMGDAAARAYAGALIQQGENYRQGFQRVMAGGPDIDHIWIDTSPDTGSNAGLYNPVSGMLTQNPPVEALVDPANTWIFRWMAGDETKLIALKNVGTSAGGEHVMLISGVKKEVCQQIELRLLGLATIPTLGPNGTSSNLFLTYPPPAVDLSNDPATDGRPAACVELNDWPGIYVYYVAILES